MSRPEVTIQTEVTIDKPKTKKTRGFPRGFRLTHNCELARVYSAPVDCPRYQKNI